MFSTPKHGWTEWTIKDHHIGRISYLEPVPAVFISECIKYISDPNAFNLVFDAEGYYVGLVQINDTFYSYDSSSETGLNDLFAVSDMLTDSLERINFIKSLLKEAINDFEKDFEDWVLWEVDDIEDTDSVTYARSTLSYYIMSGKDALLRTARIPELGNLLFGNSRGNYPVDRETFEPLWLEFFEPYFDGYGYFLGSNLSSTDRGGYENDTFLIEPYYWGDDDEIAELPNFVFKPENITIDWYKYPFRDSYSNVPISEEKARKIFRICAESIKHDRQ